MKLTDLSTGKKANEGAFLHLSHPTEPDTKLFRTEGETKFPVGLTLLGDDSDLAVDQTNAITDRILDPKNKDRPSSAENDAEQGRLMAARIKDWQGIPMGWVDGTDDETPAPFSLENAVKLMLNRGVRWVREQASRFSGTRANFIGASKTLS